MYSTFKISILQKSQTYYTVVMQTRHLQPILNTFQYLLKIFCHSRFKRMKSEKYLTKYRNF